MALYSLHTSAISRKAGRSAVAAAAYRAGVELIDERSGVVHDYTRKRGVEHVELFAPDGIQLDDPSALWNAAEAAEVRKDGRPAREVLVALPAELDADQRTDIAQAITRDLVDRYGVAAQLAIHAPDRDGDQRNHHAHILITTRRYNHDGIGAKAQLEWSGTQCRDYGVAKPKDEIKALRQRWADIQNAALERAGVDARVDHRSLADQEIYRVPQIHVGSYGTDMIRKGTPEQSERAMTNLAIIDGNQEVAELRQQVAFENAEQHIEQRHQLQIRAEMRSLYAAQQRVYDRREETEWNEWISRPDVDPTTGRIYTEAAVDACIERERALPENQSSGGLTLTELAQKIEQKEAAQKAPKPSSTAAKPSPPPQGKGVQKPPQAPPLAASEPKEQEPQPEQPPAFDARQRALEIVKMATAGERHAAFRAAFELPDDDYDALDVALEPLMSGLTGELTEEGRQLRAELVPSETSNSQRAERVQGEQDWEPPGSPGGPGF